MKICISEPVLSKKTVYKANDAVEFENEGLFIVSSYNEDQNDYFGDFYNYKAASFSTFVEENICMEMDGTEKLISSELVKPIILNIVNKLLDNI